jgi:hypothetical protein
MSILLVFTLHGPFASVAFQLLPRRLGNNRVVGCGGGHTPGKAGLGRGLLGGFGGHDGFSTTILHRIK